VNLKDRYERTALGLVDLGATNALFWPDWIIMELRQDWPDDGSLAYALLRVTLGLNIFMHGTSRLMTGIGNFVSGLIKSFQNTALPEAVVGSFGYALPWLEASIGLFLIIGFKTREVLVAGALLMMALTFGTALRQDWEVAGLQLLYSAVYTALIAALRHNSLSLDQKFAALNRERETQNR
jgi:thiosulfate dehydrogenase (quinone) large subunit